MENRKLKNCKTCGTEVAKSAKICPQCGAKLKKGHPVLIVIIAFLVVIIAVASSGNSDEPQKVENSTPAQNTDISSSQDTEGEKKNTFTVGETAALKGVNVTLVKVTESEGSAYNTPTEGNVFILCEFNIENNSNKEIAVSSMLSFEAYCDDYVCNYSVSALLEKDNKNQLDGTVAAGKKMNGVIGYEVPSNWKEFEIVFTPDFWSGKDITFIAKNK